MELEETPTEACRWCIGHGLVGRAPDDYFPCEVCDGDGWVYVLEAAQRAAQKEQGN